MTGFPLPPHIIFRYTISRRGSGRRRNPWPLCHGVIHHAHHRTRPQHPRHRLLLLAAVHPRCLSAPVRCRPDGGLGRLSQRRQHSRRDHRRRDRRGRDFDNWADRLCHDPITSGPRSDRATLCGAGGDRWLQRHARFRPNGHSVRGLAGGLRSGRGCRCRRHGLGTDGAVRPTRGGAAHCYGSGYPSAGRREQAGVILGLVNG